MSRLYLRLVADIASAPPRSARGFWKSIAGASALVLLAACGDNNGGTAGDAGAEHYDHRHMAPGEHIDSHGSAGNAATADGSLHITGAYLRQPAPGQSVLAAFARLNNTSDSSFTLHHISSPRAESVELHRTVYEEGVMRMREVRHLVVPPETELAFEPGGTHLMLSGVQSRVEPGETIPLVFTFEGGVTLTVEAQVRPLQ